MAALWQEIKGFENKIHLKIFSSKAQMLEFWHVYSNEAPKVENGPTPLGHGFKP